MAQVIPGSFSRTDRGLVSIGNGEYVDAQSPEGRASMGLPPTGYMPGRYIPGSSFASQGFTPEEGRASMGLAPTRYMPGSSFASQGFTPEEGRASMGLAPTQQEKYNSSIEAMKQFNLGAFERAAPGTIFGQGNPGFQSPTMKASEMGFNNIYNSLFGMGGM